MSSLYSYLKENFQKSVANKKSQVFIEFENELDRLEAADDDLGLISYIVSLK